MDILAPVAGIAVIWSVVALAKISRSLRKNKKALVGLSAAAVVAGAAIFVLVPHVVVPDYSRGDTKLRAMLLQ